ncbi:MAG: hypothetical protein P8Z38_10305 [Robiginitalea sp.]|jgi:hypothetical protein
MPYVEIYIIFPPPFGYYFPTPIEIDFMTCLECEKELSYMDHRRSMELFQAELCPYHRKRLERLLVKSKLPAEAVVLYYGLRQQGIRPMLAWWDGKKTVDLAISRVRLNIAIERGYESLSYRQAMHFLETNLQAFEDGFTSIRIPRQLIRNGLSETVDGILRIMEGLREKSRVV